MARTSIVPDELVPMPEPGEPPAEQRVRPANRPAPARGPSARPGASSYRSTGDQVVREPQSQCAYPGAELIGSGSASEILQRILTGDPLGVVDRARGWLDTNAFLMDSNRLALRTMAHIAHAARRYEGKPDLRTWIEILLERAVKELINEDREQDRASAPVRRDEIAPYAFLAEALGIEPRFARRTCVIFNGMEEYDRQVFYATSVLGKSLHRHVSEGHGPPAKAEAALQRVLRRLTTMDDVSGSDA